MDKMREEFEEWAKNEDQCVPSCYFEWVDEYTHYAIDEMQFAWKAWQAASAQPSDEQSSVVAHPADNIDTIKEDRDRNERMFLAACQTLAQISDALGLDSDDSDPESLLDAIAELKSAQHVAAIDTSSERVEKYCENRHDQPSEHEMKDRRCECCGYMTYQREHLGCIRAAHNAINADEYSEAVGRVRTVGGYPDESAHKVDWLVKYSRLKDGDLLYTAPPAQVPDDAMVDAAFEAMELRGFRIGASDIGMDDMRAILSAALAAAPQSKVGELTRAAQDVLAERRRQVESEGWTPEHDDEHAPRMLATAGACYAIFWMNESSSPLSIWPWDESWWKPSEDPRRNWIRAAALMLAEIERYDRADQQPKGGGE